MRPVKAVFRKAAAVAAAAAAAIAASSCRRSDVKDLVIRIPALEEGSECHSNVVEILERGQLPGVICCEKQYGMDKVSHYKPVYDFKAHTVSLSYESLSTNTKNIEMAIARKGWEANGVTPESVGVKPAGAAPAKPAPVPGPAPAKPAPGPAKPAAVKPAPAPAPAPATPAPLPAKPAPAPAAS